MNKEIKYKSKEIQDRIVIGSARSKDSGTIKAISPKNIDCQINYNEHDDTDGVISKDLQILKGIYGDSRRYLQVILNFLSNALKFTPENGGISIRISILEQ
jgi:signal transduction histidine kinase